MKFNHLLFKLFWFPYLAGKMKFNPFCYSPWLVEKSGDCSTLGEVVQDVQDQRMARDVASLPAGAGTSR